MFKQEPRLKAVAAPPQHENVMNVKYNNSHQARKF
jgi:hypothetical protein